MQTTVKENDRITKMENSLEVVKKDLLEVKTDSSEIKYDISIIKSALVGNELSGEKGVVGQVGALKVEIDYLKKDIKELQLEKEKTVLAMRIIAGVAFLLLTAVIKLFFDILK